MTGGGISMHLKAITVVFALLVSGGISAHEQLTSSTSTDDIKPVFLPLDNGVTHRTTANEARQLMRVGCSDRSQYCRYWGTDYCADGWSYKKQPVNKYWCRKTCRKCKSPRKSPPPRRPSHKPPRRPPHKPPRRPAHKPPRRPAHKPPRRPAHKPPRRPSSGYSFPPEHRELLRLVNQGRAQNGKPPLCLNRQLSAAALGHSMDMARQNYFKHDSKDGRKFHNRLTAAGYPDDGTMGENIAAGYFTPAAVYQGWKNSPGHWSNILGDFKHMGIGVYDGGSYRKYWTQDFGGSPTARCS